MVLTNTIKYSWIIIILYMIIGIMNVSFYNNRYTNIPLWKKSNLIEYLKEGDIIFQCYSRLPLTLSTCVKPALLCNGGLSHVAIVLEENKKKFLLHCVPNKMFKYKKKDIIPKPDYNFLITDWEIIKQPLSDFINSSSSVYTIYRSPTKNKINIEMLQFKPILFNTVFYCSIMIGDILVDHNYIKPSTFFARHIPDKLIENLLEHGYYPTTCRV